MLQILIMLRFQKAGAYCAQYGKLAVFRSSDTQLVAVFDCKAQR